MNEKTLEKIRGMTDAEVIGEVLRLKDLPTSALQQLWGELYNAPPRSFNRPYLFKRLAWRLQEIRYGGLSEGVLARLGGLAKDHPFWREVPREVSRALDQVAKAPAHRDPRLPAPGTILKRVHDGKEHEVRVLEDGGFEYGGTRYRSLSAVARAITGTRWNGLLFFGIAHAKGKAA